MQDEYQHWGCCAQSWLRCRLLLYKLLLLVGLVVIAPLGLALAIVCLPGLVRLPAAPPVSGKP